MTSANDRAILHDKMQEMYDRCQMGQKPKNYLPVLCEFSSELAINPLLEEERQALAKEGQNTFLPFAQLRKEIFQELEQTINIIAPHAETVPGLPYYVNQCTLLKQTRKADTWDLTFDINLMIMGACDLIRIDRFGGDHTEILKKLVRFDEKGNFIEYIYAPSLKKWDHEYQLVQSKQRNSVWYSANVLIQLFNFSDPHRRLTQQADFLQNKQESIAYNLNLEAQKFDLALETTQADIAVKLGFDVEELKIHQHRVWMYLKPRLIKTNSNKAQGPSEFIYSYSEDNDLRKGILKYEQKSCELTGNSAQIIYLAATRKNVSADEAGEELPENGKSPKERSKNALRVVNNNVAKAFLKSEFISTKSGIMSINYPISLK